MTTLSVSAQDNVWVALNNGEFPLPVSGMKNLNGFKFHWLPNEKKIFTAPYFWGGAADQRLFDVDTSQWSMAPGVVLNQDLVPDRWDSPLASCYMPGLDRVLFLREEWSYSKNSVDKISGWLLDVPNKELTGLLADVSFGDVSADFELDGGRDGMRMPIWGSMVYDPINKEAVTCGGGGIWGRVGKTVIPLSVGEWFYDAGLGRVRYVTPSDAASGISGRKWYPGHCGTWTFSEANKIWSASTQPLHEQPSPRILSAMAYADAAQKIYAFGGDDLGKCLNDFWSYDCTTRLWSEVQVADGPSPRAFSSMVYDVANNALVLIGGYKPGWEPLGDVWIYKINEQTWTCVGNSTYDSSSKQVVSTGVGLPALGYYGSAIIVPETGDIILGMTHKKKYIKNVYMYSIHLDFSQLNAVANEITQPTFEYHCKAKRLYPTPLPGEWLLGSGVPEDKATVVNRLQTNPANTWVESRATLRAIQRAWGSYVYDIRTHKGFAWGGGHSAYPGTEYDVFNLEINRWDGMKQATAYNPLWLFGMVNGPPGMTFGGWSFLPSHARKSYGIDPLSNSLVSFSGDVLDIEEQAITQHVSAFPIDWGGPSHQMACVTTPHGLYGFAAYYVSSKPSVMARVNVDAGTWDVVATGGPSVHDEHDFLVYDSKRDAVLHFTSNGSAVHRYDFQTDTWTLETAVGKVPPFVLGDATYIPEMDSVCMVFTPDKSQSLERLFWCFKY